VKVKKRIIKDKKYNMILINDFALVNVLINGMETSRNAANKLG